MNTLKFQPDERPIQRSTQSAEFWSIWIDKKQFATLARPFDSSSHEIVLAECDFCYGCGMPEFEVRRSLADTIIWFASVDDANSSSVPRGTVFEFDRSVYVDQLGGDVSDLPALNEKDLDLILLQQHRMFPNAETCIYTVPDLPCDPMGDRTTKLIRQAISDDRIELATSDSNEKHNLTVGQDAESFTETVLQLQHGEDGTSFRFLQNPHLPIWMRIRHEPFPFAKLHSESTIAR